MDQLSILYFLAISIYFWKGCEKACTTLLPNPPAVASCSDQAGNTFIIHPDVKTIDPGHSLPISYAMIWVSSRVKISRALRG